MKKVIDRVLGYIKNTDLTIWILCLALSAFSLVLLAGILDTGYENYLGISLRNLFVQGGAIAIGVFIAVIVSLIDYTILAKLWKIYIPICYILLILTFFVGVGAAERPDDKRWLVVPFLDVNFQPAELLRIAFILVFAYHVFHVHEHINEPSCLAGVLFHGAIPVIIVHFQGDDGSALIFLAIICFILFSAGISWKYIAAAAVLVTGSIPILWNFVVSDFQKQRVLAIYNPSAYDMRDILYQQYRAVVAIGSGGSGGTGLFGIQHMYIPEMHNDFIFSFLAECFGYVGSLITIIVMIVLFLKILHCSQRSKDLLGQLICIGVFGMLAFQSAINIGMNLSLLPVIGNTLPFLSYGGSSMFTSFLGIGLVQSVYLHSPSSIFDRK